MTFKQITVHLYTESIYKTCLTIILHIDPICEIQDPSEILVKIYLCPRAFNKDRLFLR